MFGRRGRGERAARVAAEQAAEQAVSSGPVDVEAIRSVIADVVGSRPSGAVQVTESRVRMTPFPGHPEHDFEVLRMSLVPRAAKALDVVIDVFEEASYVAVYVDDDNPIELTAPININNVPRRPFLDVVREVLLDVSRGEVDVARRPDGDLHDLRYWREDGRRPAGDPAGNGCTWAPAAAWT